MGVGLPPRDDELWEAGGASSPSESSSRAVAPTFTASRRARVPDTREAAAVLHLGRSLHYGDVPVRLVGDLDQVCVYPRQSQAMGLVEETRIEDILLSLTGDHELFSHRPRLTSASR